MSKTKTADNYLIHLYLEIRCNGVLVAKTYISIESILRSQQREIQLIPSGGMIFSNTESQKYERLLIATFLRYIRWNYHRFSFIDYF